MKSTDSYKQLRDCGTLRRGSRQRGVELTILDLAKEGHKMIKTVFAFTIVVNVP
jgi:hypothetical protein